MSGRGGDDLAIEFPNLREVLAEVRAFSPRLARELRRDLRSVGDQVIAEQKAILDGPLPTGITHTGYTIKRVRPTKGRGYFRKVRTYADTDVKRSRTRGLREAIKAGLKTRVTAGKSRQEVSVRTTGPKDDGYNMAKVWQSERFRHPVFGSDTWVDQKGQPYFWGPAYRGRDEMQRRVMRAIDAATQQMSN